MSKEVKDLENPLETIKENYEELVKGVELIQHFNLSHVGRVLPNQRQSERDLKRLKEKAKDFKDAAEDLHDVLKHLL